MRQKFHASAAPAAVLMVAVAIVALVGSTTAKAQNARWGANYFPNVVLTTQDGEKVHFYEDLVKGKIVAIDLIYTTCKYACPLETARLAQVQRLLGDRVGKDVFFYSITIDPEHDTPEVLKEYAKKYNAGPGWLFLNAKQDDVDLISKKLGLYSEPDPANKDGHQPGLLIGNEVTGQWMRVSATDNARFLATTIGDWMTSWQTARTLPVKNVSGDAPLHFERGEYEFTSHCAPCHSIGQGEKIGPDLAGVTETRDRAWLMRFIKEPDKVLDSNDPIARSLLARFKTVRMPRLDLTDGDVTEVLTYIEKQTAAARAAAPAGTKVSK